MYNNKDMGSDDILVVKKAEPPIVGIEYGTTVANHRFGFSTGR